MYFTSSKIYLKSIHAKFLYLYWIDELLKKIPHIKRLKKNFNSQKFTHNTKKKSINYISK